MPKRTGQPSKSPRPAFTDFLRSESVGGAVLIVVTAIALAIGNSSLAAAFSELLHTPLFLEQHGHTMSLLDWINDGLMAIFFFGVGMEIRRELTHGELSSARARLLPVGAAVGGMLVPALIYWIVAGGSEASRGWAIPAATDIAFSLGILSLLGRRIARSVKVFVSALAIIDDLGAVVIIAFFYSSNIQLSYLLAGTGIVTVQWYLSRRYLSSPTGVVSLGIALWYVLLQAGVHPTIAGVASGLLLPTSSRQERLERTVTPLVAYAIVPIFALVNANVAISGSELGTALGSGVGLAVLLGLVIGKPIGVTLGASLVRRGGSHIPLRLLVGAAMVCGIGFTMSLFVTQLAFTSAELIAQAKIAILGGSLISGLAGYFYLRTLGSKAA